MNDITNVEIRMYRAGTGDCFILKFFSQGSVVFKMMIDGGTWSGKKTELEKFVLDLKSYVDNAIDLLVVTHEHKDHVYLFDVCESLFLEDFAIGEVWMGWTEDDQNEMVQEWKEKFGQKKMALALASKDIQQKIKDQSAMKQLQRNFGADNILHRFKTFSSSLQDFVELHHSPNRIGKIYKGGLQGMENVKKKLAKNNIRYCRPGSTERISKLEGVNFHILGPPLSYDSVQDHGDHAKEGSIYDHNEILKRSDSFTMAINKSDSIDSLAPFSNSYYDDDKLSSEYYYNDENAWRNIDLDWLVGGAGNLALRLNTGINNLSLAIAIEFENSGKVMLFPGDAEFGSWNSWHKIQWDGRSEEQKHFTEDLLNRTVFYKVAHHLSHNGTAKDKGLKMMNSSDLISMATLDYETISSHWKSTMPNRDLLKDIITRTKGRFIVMNENGLFYDFKEKETLSDRINDEKKRMTTKEQKAFEKAYSETELYKQIDLKL